MVMLLHIQWFVTWYQGSSANPGITIIACPRTDHRSTDVTLEGDSSRMICIDKIFELVESGRVCGCPFDRGRTCAGNRRTCHGKAKLLILGFNG